MVSLVALDVPGGAAADLLPTIDRRWSRWPHDATLLPPSSAMTRVFYVGALAPP